MMNGSLRILKKEMKTQDEVEDEAFEVQEVENVEPHGTVDDLDIPMNEIEMRDIDDRFWCVIYAQMNFLIMMF